jgi:hypothetical protein
VLINIFLFNHKYSTAAVLNLVLPTSSIKFSILVHVLVRPYPWTVAFKLNSNQINEPLRGGFDRIDWNQGLKQNFGKVMKILDLSSETPRRGSMQKPTDYISESKPLE